MRFPLFAVLLLSACAEEPVRPTPPECDQRRAAAAKAAVDVATWTKEAREALGEEAATLAWWEVREAEAALEEAQDAARGCP